jgi:hypothetical protein
MGNRPRHPLNRRLIGSHSPSGRCEQSHSLPLPGTETRFYRSTVHSIAAIPTELYMNIKLELKLTTVRANNNLHSLILRQSDWTVFVWQVYIKVGVVLWWMQCVITFSQLFISDLMPNTNKLIYRIKNGYPVNIKLVLSFVHIHELLQYMVNKTLKEGSTLW